MSLVSSICCPFLCVFCVWCPFLCVLVFNVPLCVYLVFSVSLFRNHYFCSTLPQDRSIGVWEMQSPSDIKLRRVLLGHSAAVNVVCFDQKYIVSGSGDRTIRMWSTSSCEFVRRLDEHTRGIACLHYREKLAVSGSSDNTIRWLL